MKRTFFLLSLNLVLAFFVSSGLFYVYATELTPQDKSQYFEITEERENGDDIVRKIPVIEDPCKYGKDAKLKALQYIKEHKNANVKYEIEEATAILKEIKAKKFDDLSHLATVINLYLPKWACENNYKIHKTKHLGNYYFKKFKDKEISLAVMEDGYLPNDGVREGRANLQLQTALSGNDMYFQVVIGKLPYNENGKIENTMDKDAKKILDEVVNGAYAYGEIYYSVLISELNKQIKK